MKYKQIDVINRAFVRAITDPSLYEFNRIILAYPDINEAVHKPMCDFYQPPADTDENDYAMDLEPRNTMKSTFCIVGGAIWSLAIDPNDRLLILCSSEDEAKKRLKTAKEKMLASDLLKYFYYDMARNSRSNTWRQDSIIVAGRTAVDIEPSIDTAGRGTDKTGNHYRKILIDDLENEKTTVSEDELANTKRYFKRLSPCMQPKWSIMRITGTRWSFDDCYSLVLGENELDKGTYNFFRTRVMSAVKPDGTLYYPERLTQKFLDRERRFLGNYLYSCNYLNNPVPDEDAAFSPLDATYYYGEYIKQGTARYINVEKVVCSGRPAYKYIPREKVSETDMVQIRSFLMIDPALSDKDHGCYTGIVVAGRDLFENRIWVVDALRIKSQDPSTAIDALMRMYFKYEPLSVVIEDVAYQLSIKSYFEAECKKNHIYPNIQTVGRTDHRSKHERILGLSSYWKSNSIMLPIQKAQSDDSNYIRSLVDEMAHFPKSRTLDLADALSRILDIDFNLRTRNQSKDILKIEADYCSDWK